MMHFLRGGVPALTIPVILAVGAALAMPAAHADNDNNTLTTSDSTTAFSPMYTPPSGRPVATTTSIAIRSFNWPRNGTPTTS